MSDKSTKQKAKGARALRGRVFRQRPLLSLPQILVLIAIVVAIYIGVDLNHRAQTGRLIRANELALEAKVAQESTRQIELIVTRDYVNSKEFTASFARNEAGMSLANERRIVPLVGEISPLPTPVPTTTPDPAYDARSWQAWWRLFTDAQLPAR